jgi:hypothetical protein
LLLRRYFNPLYHLPSTLLRNLAPARWPLLHTLLVGTLIPGIPAVNFVLHPHSVDHPRAPCPFSPHDDAAQVLLSTVGIETYCDFPRTPHTNPTASSSPCSVQLSRCSTEGSGSAVVPRVLIGCHFALTTRLRRIPPALTQPTVRSPKSSEASRPDLVRVLRQFHDTKVPERVYNYSLWCTIDCDQLARHLHTFRIILSLGTVVSG